MENGNKVVLKMCMRLCKEDRRNPLQMYSLFCALRIRKEGRSKWEPSVKE